MVVVAVVAVVEMVEVGVVTVPYFVAALYSDNCLDNMTIDDSQMLAVVA